MAPTAAPTVESYLAAQPAAARGSLEQVRAVIRAALPGAEEVISYRIPAYRLGGRVVLFFAGWKNHYALYPASERVIAAFADRLAPGQVDKGTIRFRYTAPVPVALIGEIATLRAAEAAGGGMAPAAAPEGKGSAWNGS